jgi:hypothetical protein
MGEKQRAAPKMKLEGATPNGSTLVSVCFYP